MNEKFEKTKVWMKNHKEELQTAAFVTGIVAFYAGLITVAYKVAAAQQAEAQKAMDTIAEAVSRGASVIPGPDGGFWIIEPKE